MDKDLVGELRQLLQDMVVSDLETIMLKLDAIQQQLMLTQQAVLSEIATVRAEMQALRAEMRGQSESSVAEDEAPADPQRYLM